MFDGLQCNRTELGFSRAGSLAPDDVMISALHDRVDVGADFKRLKSCGRMSPSCWRRSNAASPPQTLTKDATRPPSVGKRE